MAQLSAATVYVRDISMNTNYPEVVVTSPGSTKLAPVQAWEEHPDAGHALTDGPGTRQRVVAAVRGFLLDWFGAGDLANVALGPLLNGTSVFDTGIDESPQPVLQQGPSLPDVRVLAHIFNMNEAQIEATKQFSAASDGWKMFRPHCKVYFNQVSSTVAGSISVQEGHELFLLLGQKFFKHDVGNRLDEDVCERFANSGTKHSDVPQSIPMLQFSEAFQCYKACLILELRSRGVIDAMPIEFKNWKDTGYKRIKRVAEGAHSKTWLADSKERGRVMVKKFKQGKAQAVDHPNNNLYQEMLFYSRLHPSPHILHVFEIFQDDSYLYSACPVFPGDLTLLRKVGVDLTLEYFKGVFTQCLKGLCHLHDHGIVHCDLKESVYVFKTRDFAKPEIAIADVCMARLAADPSITAGVKNPPIITGTPGYRPPEVNYSNLWTPKGDIFSVGVTFFQLLTDRVPNAEDGKLGIFQEGAKLPTLKKDITRITATRQVPTHLLSSEHFSVKNWLCLMMKKDRHRRLTSFQVLQLPWFEDGADLSLSSPSRDSSTAVVADSVDDIFGATVEGQSEEEMMMESDVFPFFTFGQTISTALLWLISVHLKEDEEGRQWGEALGGLERFFPGKTDLRLNDECTDYRWQVWRWILYQFSHVGLGHIGTNSVLNILMGVPLERLHGTLRSALMYNVGVVGGALCYIVGDARHSVVGMSGGCYSLIGVHLAYTIINWHQRKYRWVVVTLILLFAAADAAHIWGFADRSGETKPSNSAHFGGAVAGLVIGILIGENLKVKMWERVLWCCAFVVGAGLVSFCIIWLMVWPPMNVWDHVRFCWIRQVYNTTLFSVGAKEHWRCVRCGDQACIDSWMRQTWVVAASYDECAKVIGWADVN
jgi:rhomboid-related protein 1/2/3